MGQFFFYHVIQYIFFFKKMKRNREDGENVKIKIQFGIGGGNKKKDVVNEQNIGLQKKKKKKIDKEGKEGEGDSISLGGMDTAIDFTKIQNPPQDSVIEPEEEGDCLNFDRRSTLINALEGRLIAFDVKIGKQGGALTNSNGSCIACSKQLKRGGMDKHCSVGCNDLKNLYRDGNSPAYLLRVESYAY